MKGNIGIVAGYSSGRLLAPALHYRGAKCVHIKPALVPDRLLRTYQATDYQAECNEIADIDALVTELTAREVTDIYPGSEIGVPLAWVLKQKLGQTQVKNIEPFYDKWAQTELLRAHGLRATRQGRFLDVAEAIKWARHHALHQVVAKPCASTGSDHVLLCQEPFEVSLNHAFTEILNQTNELARMNSFVLVQEKLLGEEYVIDLVIAGQEARIAAVFKYLKAPANGADFVYHSMSTISSDDLSVQPVIDFALKAAKALVSDSFDTVTAVHMELIGECLVEAGFRTHGGQGVMMGKDVSGLGQIEMLADAIADRQRFLQHPIFPKAHGIAREVFLISHQTGRLHQFAHINTIENLSSFRRLASRVGPGDMVYKTRDLLTSPGSVVLVCEDPGQLDDDEAAIRSLEKDGLYQLA